MADISNKSMNASEKIAGALEKKSKTKKRFRGISIKTALIITIIVLGSIAIFTTVMVIRHNSQLRAARAEYDSLRELAEEIESTNNSELSMSELEREMRQINPDYVGWIRIDGTSIDYPVVRGSDNDKYIHTSFQGEESIAGAIFMDYRNVGDLLTYRVGEALPHIIIYGHNMQRGGMFSDLRGFINSRFLEENNIITLIIDGETVEFEIFSARLSDINDPAYYLTFDASHSFPRFADRVGAPLQATQIITLSTCARRDGGGDARVIVQGYRLFD